MPLTTPMATALYKEISFYFEIDLQESHICLHVSKAQYNDEIDASFQRHLQSPDDWHGQSRKGDISEDIKSYLIFSSK